MKHPSKGLFYFAVLLVFLGCLTPETEGRRLVLRGRRTITRHYYRPLAIPAWAIIVCIALANLLLGVAFYFILYKLCLSDKRPPTTNTYAAATLSEESYPIREAA